MTIYFTLQETNISPQKWHFEDDFFFPKVGYVNLLEGIYFTFHFHTLHTSMHTWHALTGFTYQKRSPFPGKVLTSGVPGGWHFNLNLNLIWTWWLPKKQRLTFFWTLKMGMVWFTWFSFWNRWFLGSMLMFQGVFIMIFDIWYWWVVQVTDYPPG